MSTYYRPQNYRPHDTPDAVTNECCCHVSCTHRHAIDGPYISISISISNNRPVSATVERNNHTKAIESSHNKSFNATNKNDLFTNSVNTTITPPFDFSQL